MERRLKEHNSKSQIYSRCYASWELMTYICNFSNFISFNVQQRVLNNLPEFIIRNSGVNYILITHFKTTGYVNNYTI